MLTNLIPILIFSKILKNHGLIHKIEHLSTDWDDKPLKDAIITGIEHKQVTPYTVTDDVYE